MLLPVGVSNFRKLIEHRSKKGERYLFVDKSMLIDEVMEDGSDVIVITRPRRFGKTINMSMLQHFLSKEVDDKPTKHLFAGLNIAEHADTMEKHQGKYPVIFVSFKDIKSSNFDECLEMIKGTITDLYESFKEQLYSNKIDSDKRNFAKTIIEGKASKVELSRSLKKLTEYLRLYYDKKPILIIDEYDAPIIEAYTKKYYSEAIDFFKNLLSSVLKDNPYLEKGIITGVLRIAKESIFSDLNNVEVYSILHNKYSGYFGFTDSEVKGLLEQAKLPSSLQEARQWYNGYTFGNSVVYNPWSIIKFIKEEGKLVPYWINTSSNNLIKEQVINSRPEFQDKLQELMLGNSVSQTINEYIVFDDLATNQVSVWSLMLMSGYIKATNIRSKGLRKTAELSIPNQEVWAFYEYTIMEWLSFKYDLDWYDSFINSLTTGNIKLFAEMLQELVINTFSFHDTNRKNGESLYHGLMLGLVAGLHGQYQIKSNRESGHGRFDTMLIPNDKTANGIVFEFKVADSEEQLDSTADKALQQIIDKNYTYELQQQGIENVIKIAIAFAGKKIKVISQ